METETAATMPLKSTVKCDADTKASKMHLTIAIFMSQ